MDTRRHAPRGRERVRFVQSASDRRPLANFAHTRRSIYSADHSDTRRSGRFRWLLSTCVAAVVGLLAILVVVAGSIDTQEYGLPALLFTPVNGLRWAIPKTDKLLIASGATATAFLIRDPVRQPRGDHEYIFDKPYYLLMARLAPISKAEAEAVPYLNPTELFANTTPLGQTDSANDRHQVADLKIVELIGGILPNEDGQELDLREVADLVAHALAVGDEPAGSETAERLTSVELIASEMPPPNTSILLKSAFAADGRRAGDAAGRDSRVDAFEGDSQPDSASLYASLHHTAAKLGIPNEVILQIIKIHAYETDFRQPVRAGDGFEVLFDAKRDDKGADGNVGELLATAITSSGETHKFYRFRTSDGTIDYYDERGNTSRKFLMRRPVRCEEVRLTSGFGRRRHPILQVLRMHWGEDWACAMGTPIMAAGSGVIEEAGRKGEYGNYIRIRHANGYKTAYGHMSRFAAGASDGIKVRQGQIIGYVGTTGLSSAPHVHFEVLVRNGADHSDSPIDPMSIRASRERRLTVEQLADFQRERARVDALIRRNLVLTRVVSATTPPSKPSALRSPSAR